MPKLPRHADLTATFPKPLLGPASCVTWIDEQFLDGSDLRCEQHVQCGTMVEGLLS